MYGFIRKYEGINMIFRKMNIHGIIYERVKKEILYFFIFTNQKMILLINYIKQVRNFWQKGFKYIKGENLLNFWLKFCKIVL